jgi:hypothetical protein
MCHGVHARSFEQLLRNPSRAVRQPLRFCKCKHPFRVCLGDFETVFEPTIWNKCLEIRQLQGPALAEPWAQRLLSSLAPE